jgi:hypothetical protein
VVGAPLGSRRRPTGDIPTEEEALRPVFEFSGGWCGFIIPDLADQLARDVQENRLSDHLRSLRHPTLLILDEMGYLPLDQVATSFLFQFGMG